MSVCHPGSWARSPLRTVSLHTSWLGAQLKHAGGLASDHLRRAGVKVAPAGRTNGCGGHCSESTMGARRELR